MLLLTILCGRSFQKCLLWYQNKEFVTPDVQHRPQKQKPLISTLRGWRQSLRCWHMHYHPRFTLTRCWDEWGELPLSTLLSQTLCKCWSCWIMGILAQWLSWKLRKRGKEEGGKNSADKNKMLFGNYLILIFLFWVNLQNFVWHKTQYCI